MNKFKEAAEHCRRLGLKEIDPSIRMVGLCHEISLKYLIHLSNEIDFSLYPNFSGDLIYPIKSPCGTDPGEFYNNCRDAWQGLYGDERRKFCLWAADELEKIANAE